MKSPVFLVVISLVVGFFLGGLITFSFLSQQDFEVIERPEESADIVETVNLYSLTPVERVHFNARGSVTEISQEEIVIEKDGGQLKAAISQNVRVMIFAPPEEIQEGAMVEPQAGTLEDIKPGMEVNLFGLQYEDGSLTVDSITADRQ